MKPLIRFRVEARLDIQEAYDWYEERLQGIGDRFLAAVDQCIDRVAANPSGFPTVYADVRRALLQTFPYSVLYRVEGDFITVLGCFHGRRDPRRSEERR